MNALAIGKVLAGVTLATGAVTVPTVLLTGSAQRGNVIEKVEVKSYLKDGLGPCKLLDTQKSKEDYSQKLYACPMADNKLEMVYYEEKNGQEKLAKKIKELKQGVPGLLRLPELQVTLEDGTQKTLNWPSLLFNYSEPRGDGKTTLDPSTECKFVTGVSTLFECNNTWKVIKRP